jgi:DNA-binding winged helix-turn-helix (wHTH) protein/TolB-like protein
VQRQTFHIAEFRIDPARNAIASPDGETLVEPKMMEVLCALAARPGHVFSRTELMDQVWGHSHGADESLTRAISQLRKVFGDSREEARILETIQKRGYRLIAPVTPGSAGAGKAASRSLRPFLWGGGLAGALLLAAGLVFWRAPPAEPVPNPVQTARAVLPSGIAVSVRPFAAEAGALSSLAAGLRTALVTDMSRNGLLHLRTETRQAGGLHYRVEGVAQKIGARIRVNIQLIAADTGEHLWGADFEPAAGANLAAQDALAAAINFELVPRILNAAKAQLRNQELEKLAPWELILLATSVPGSDEVYLSPHTRDAFWLQRRALALDPGYAPAHALLASALAYHALFDKTDNTPAALAEAERHVQLALAKAPYAPDVLYQAANYYRYRGQGRKAADILRRILEIHPNNIRASVDLPFMEGQCSAGGQAALAQLRAMDARLLPANPLRRIVLSHIATLHLSQGNYRAARAAAVQSRAIIHTTWSGVTLAAALAALGSDREAQQIATETRREWPNLDFEGFAGQALPLWCLEGDVQGPTQRAFRALAMLERPSR